MAKLVDAQDLSLSLPRETEAVDVGITVNPLKWQHRGNVAQSDERRRD